jgi:hypothetical protein
MRVRNEVLVSSIKKLAVPIAECGFRIAEFKTKNSREHSAWRYYLIVKCKAQGARDTETRIAQSAERKDLAES